MKIYFGNDHAAFDMRQGILEHLRAAGHEVVDFGWASTDRSDYPDFAHAVARAVEADSANGQNAIGVLICGSGVGMSIAANRHAGIRAALVLDAWTARMCRAHNNANIICLRAREQALKSNLQFLDIFIAEPFEGGRHADRLAKLNC